MKMDHHGKMWLHFYQTLIPEGSFVCEYKGVLMSAKEGREKEKQYDSEGQGNF